jgi:GT2 family glycosyltransferase
VTDSALSRKTSVVVPSFGRPDLLRACLAALEAQTTPPDEVLVVARVGDDETAGVARAATGTVPVSLLTIDRPGHLPPLALACGEAKGDVVAFLDDDAEPWPAWLAALLRHYVKHRVGGAGGLVHQPATHDRRVATRPGRIGLLGRFDRTGIHLPPAAWGPREVDVLRGTNMSFRRELLAEYPWDARLNDNAATDYEVDLCSWVRRRGYSIVYDPDAIVTHHLGPRPEIGRRRSPEWTRAYSHNLVYVAGKALPPPQRATALVHALFVGTRASYGPLAALADTARGRPPSLRDEVLPALAGKLGGLLSLAAYARSGPEPLAPRDTDAASARPTNR